MSDETHQPERLKALLAACVRRDASDLHLVSGLPPYLRTHGPLRPMDGEADLSPVEMEGIARRLLGERFDHLDRTGSLDGAMSSDDGTRFRFNVFRKSGGLGIALRRLEEKFRSLSELGFSDTLYRLCDLPDGLVVVSGPTGAGKSTTLATLIDRVNRTHECHVVTIEDPVEYVHESRKSLVNQRQVGSDTSGFNDALVASLRQDPDVILVGEIRDLDTIRTAITAAETGHLVFTTVHAGDCVSTIERLVGVFPSDEMEGVRRQLALVLRCVVNQQLLVADGPAAGERDDDEAPGRRQRVVASEVLMVTPAVANLIATAKSQQIYSAMESGGALGMQTLEQDLARLWTRGLITERSALNASRRPEVVRDRAEQMRHPTTGGRR